ncbi:MAG: DUF1036 domain-containing protein [Methylobacteriaceae bacterium]|nr:DUF1036 domain-containing protein [Methylobacteriaceae bacterium]
MPRFKLIFISGFFLIICSGSASAGFIVCNNTGIEVSVAVGWFENDAWSSRGWYNVKPRDCELAIAGPMTNRYVYYYAEGGSMKWEKGEDSGFFCANYTSQFYYALPTDPKCDGYSFERVDIGDNQEYIITLTESRTDPATAALNCEEKMSEGRDAFVACWTRQVATGKTAPNIGLRPAY